ncbi:MAG: hypothetical protein FVQ84_22960 [Planctomycetes bacterium]|nr:hypothetical protein [Planctomycetota bacterium]
MKDYESLTESLNGAISASAGGLHLSSGTSTAKSIEQAKTTQTITLEQVDGIRKILEGQSVISRYSEQLAKVYEVCNNLVTVADKPKPPLEELKQA